MSSVLMSLALFFPMCAQIVTDGNRYPMTDGNRYAVLVIQNPTCVTIHYAIRWGDGQWEHCTVESGRRITHWFRYAYLDQNRSPRPVVKLDCDLSSGVSHREYELNAYAAPWHAPDFGRKHDFRIIGGRELDLVAIN